MVLVLLVASVGTFVWNHGSDIFNSGNIWTAFVSELRQYTCAYVIILVEFIFMGVLLYLRQKSDGR